MADYSLTIYHLFPDLLNITGDTGNVAVLEMRCQKRGINPILKSICAGEEIDISDADIIIFGGGGEKETAMVASFKDKLASPLKEYVQRGGVLLAVCSGYQLLGDSYDAGGQKKEGLKILDISACETDKKRFGDLVIEAELCGTKAILAGFENHSFVTETKDLSPLGKVIGGTGDREAYEGVIYKNTIGTYLCGPTLPKNPELADYMICVALKNKYSDFDGNLTPLDDSLELAAKQFIVERNKREN